MILLLRKPTLRHIPCLLLSFFFNDTATTEIYTLSLHDALPIIHLAPERHHEVGDAVEPFPSPLVEFGRLTVTWCQRIDFVIGACETQREPFLALAAEFGEPMRRRHGEWRKLVCQPVGFAEIAGIGHAGLFP